MILVLGWGASTSTAAWKGQGSFPVKIFGRSSRSSDLSSSTALCEGHLGHVRVLRLLEARYYLLFRLCVRLCCPVHPTVTSRCPAIDRPGMWLSATLHCRTATMRATQPKLAPWLAEAMHDGMDQWPEASWATMTRAGRTGAHGATRATRGPPTTPQSTIMALGGEGLDVGTFGPQKCVLHTQIGLEKHPKAYAARPAPILPNRGSF